MSKEARDYVWKHSPCKGTELLLLLAIAEVADPHGVAWPSVSRLARDTRMSPRQVTRLIGKFEKQKGAPNLAVRRNASKVGTHLYQLNMGLSLPLFGDAVGDRLSPDKMSPHDSRGRKGVTNRARRGDTAMSPEPLNQKHNRPASGRQAKPVDNPYTPPAAADLKFPKGTTHKSQQAFLAIATEYRLPREQLQLAFDEVDDRLERREPVHNVVMLVRSMAKQMKEGTFYGTRAERHAQRERGGGRPLSAAELKIVPQKKVA